MVARLRNYATETHNIPKILLVLSYNWSLVEVLLVEKTLDPFELD